MSELLSCPFCGGEAVITSRKVHMKCGWFGEDYRLMYYVRCKECGARVGKLAACEYHKDERTGKEWGAIIDWNTRAYTESDNDAEVLGDIAEGLFCDLMKADPDAAKVWLRAWPELFGKLEEQEGECLKGR